MKLEVWAKVLKVVIVWKFYRNITIQHWPEFICILVKKKCYSKDAGFSTFVFCENEANPIGFSLV